QLVVAAFLVVEDDVRAAHGVRVAAQDHSGIVAAHVTLAPLEGVVGKKTHDVAAHKTVPFTGPGHLGHLPFYHFRVPIAVLGAVGPLEELFRGHELMYCRGHERRSLLDSWVGGWFAW